MLRVVLLDASGSMEPAWDVAWDVVFNTVRKASFILLAFKARRTDNVPDECTHTYHNAVIYDLGCAFSRLGIHRLRKRPRPEDVGLRFSTRTPLNDAIIFVIEQLEKRGYPYELIVVSDNRDTASWYRMEEVVQRKRGAACLRRLVLECVGSCLQKYLEPYDSVYVHGARILGPPSPFL